MLLMFKNIYRPSRELIKSNISNEFASVCAYVRNICITLFAIPFLGQEIQASGPEAQEDSRYPPAAHQARGGPHDQEDAEEVTHLLYAQICCQGLRLCFLFNKRPTFGQRCTCVLLVFRMSFCGLLCTNFYIYFFIRCETPQFVILCEMVRRLVFGGLISSGSNNKKQLQSIYDMDFSSEKGVKKNLLDMAFFFIFIPIYCILFTDIKTLGNITVPGIIPGSQCVTTDLRNHVLNMPSV